MGAPRRRLPLSLILILLAGWAMKRCASPSCCAQPARRACSCACYYYAAVATRASHVLSVAARACPSRGSEHNKMARHVRVAWHLRGALRRTCAGGNRSATRTRARVATAAPAILLCSAPRDGQWAFCASPSCCAQPRAMGILVCVTVRVELRLPPARRTCVVCGCASMSIARG